MPAAEPSEPPIREPGRFRRFAEAHPRGIDASLIVLYLSFDLGVVLGTTAGNARVQPWQPPLAGVAALAGAVALWRWRRTRPLWFLAAAVVVDAMTQLPTHEMSPLLLVIAVYAVAQRTSAPTTWLAGGGSFAIDLVVSALVRGSATVSQILPAAITWALVLSVCVHFGSRRRYVRALIDRAEALTVERDQRAQLAVARERGRIATEMHDVVAHSLAVMVTLADGAAVVMDRDPARARTALGEVSRTGRQAVTDMRHILAVLRDPSDSDATSDNAGTAAADAGGTPTHETSPRPVVGRQQGAGTGLEGTARNDDATPAATPEAPDRDSATRKRKAGTGIGPETTTSNDSAVAAAAPATPTPGTATRQRMVGDGIGGADRSPQPGAADLISLIETFRLTGLPVEFTLAGAIPRDPTLELTVYRIVQESLTNVLRYAPRTDEVAVRIGGGSDELTVDVANTAPAEPTAAGGSASGPAGQTTPHDAAPVTWDGAGSGILGMRQRAAAYGGTIAAGPDGADGWLVHAVLHPDR
jgi:signal transduction histidine kinase